MAGRPVIALLPVAALAAACDGPQSALTTAGTDAETVLGLFTWMAAGAALIWVVVVGLAIYVLRWPREHSDRAARVLIVGGGVAFPTIVLAVLLAYGLSVMPPMLAPGPGDALRLDIVGEQWWWRVHYAREDGSVIASANEVRLPAGERTNLRLYSADVIHSFWIPSIAGKMDMIPGRITRLALEPTREGRFRGACAEFCGDSHALMNFTAVVMAREAFDAWLAQQASPAAPPQDPLAIDGAAVFARSGCGACHAIRGTAADGALGPDLTHVGSRDTIGAGMLANDRGAFARWVRNVDHLKPGAHMPAYRMLPEYDVRALAAYLESLQ